MKITLRQIERYTARVAKKRDELRKLIAELQPLIDSMESADEELGWAIRNLNEAADKLSEYA